MDKAGQVVKVDSQLVQITKEAFTRDYSVKRCHDRFKKLRSIKQVILLNEPSIVGTQKQFGNDFIQAYIATWLINLNAFLSLKYSMSEEQIEETAEFIISDFYNLTIADVYLIMRNAKTGAYGKFYESLNGAMILTWFNKYFEERCDMYEQISIQESNELKGQWRSKQNNKTKKINSNGKKNIYHR